MNYQGAVAERHDLQNGPDDGLILAIISSARHIQDRLESILESVSLTPAKFQALDALVRAGEPMALSELAGSLKCVRSNITQLADRLEMDGLVNRVDDASDRRAIRAVVTPLGIERHAAGTEAIAELQSELAALVSSADRLRMVEVLSVLK
ncbi:MAG: MarR family transcriptional regulator [Gemmatimonadota bacterium]|nr:MarR family transcriptional regulator [Gemmatimonadota bacterium]